MVPHLLGNKKKKINNCHVLFIEMHIIIKTDRILFLIFAFNLFISGGILQPNRWLRAARTFLVNSVNLFQA